MAPTTLPRVGANTAPAASTSGSPYTNTVTVGNVRVDFGPEVNGARPVRVTAPGQQSAFTLREGSSSAQSNGSTTVQADGRQLKVNGFVVPFDGSAPRAASPERAAPALPPLPPMQPMPAMQPMQPLPGMQPMQPLPGMQPMTMRIGNMSMSMSPSGGMTASFGTPNTTMHIPGNRGR